MPVSFQAFKNFLAVVKHRAGRVQAERPVGHDGVVMPAVFRGPGCPGHMIGEVTAETGAGQDLTNLFLTGRVLIRVNNEPPREAIRGRGRGSGSFHFFRSHRNAHT